MKANFHTHTYRCHHAIGEDIEYVEAAVERGLSVLGFSDHSPYCFPGGYYSSFRMTPLEAEGYAASVSALKSAFAGKIKIYMGFEAEYLPEFFPETLELFRRLGCDYLILGQHFPSREIDEAPSAHEDDSEAKLALYVDNVIAAMKTGLFFYVAHPDIINFSGDIDIYREHMTRLCRAAKDAGVPLELNLLGLRQGRYYPVEEFWKIVSAVGTEVIFGCDAHRPCDVADPDNIKQAKAFAKRFSLNVVEPKKPRFLR